MDMFQDNLHDISDSDAEDKGWKEGDVMAGELDPELLSLVNTTASFNDEGSLVERYCDIELDSPPDVEVSNDVYKNPVPGCSHHFVDAQEEKEPVIVRTETISLSSWFEEYNKLPIQQRMKYEAALSVGKPRSPLDIKQMAPRNT